MRKVSIALGLALIALVVWFSSRPDETDDPDPVAPEVVERTARRPRRSRPSAKPDPSTPAPPVEPAPSPTEEPTPVDESAGPARPVLTGRLVDSARVPVPGQALLAQVLEPGVLSRDLGPSQRGRTDEAGRFRFAVDLDPGPVAGVKLRLARPSLLEIATLDLPALLGPGETELGDVVLDGRAVILSGRVVDPAGAPVAKATVRAMRNWLGRRVPVDEVEQALTDADGRFELRGTVVGEEVRLGVGAGGFFVDTEPRFRKGATDVMVTLSVAGGIAGYVRFPEGVDRDRVNVLVRGDAQRNFDTGYRFPGEGLERSIGRSGIFYIRSLRPGTASITIRTGSKKEDEVFHLEGLAITAGDINRDGRLQAIDLRSHTRVVDVRVLDSNGAPLVGAVAHYRKHGSQTFWRAAVVGDTKRASIRLGEAGGEIEVIVTAKGFRSVRRGRVREDVTVTLEPSAVSRVVVRLAEGATLPDPPFELEVRLEWLGPDGGNAFVRSKPFDPRDPTRVGKGPRVGQSRQVTLDVWEPGRYRVRLMLWRTALRGGVGRPVAAVPEFPTFPIRGDGAPVTIEVAMDEDAYRRILEEEE